LVARIEKFASAAPLDDDIENFEFGIDKPGARRSAGESGLVEPRPS
jgi:hypothetical protein